MTRDVGRYHKLPWGGGQITIPKDLVKEMKLENKDKIMIEYDSSKKSITITKLN
jgi:bifunctional DNA-binding transcriptional regulator/antitoxin component of YhaV-PrlF toxin-antitoxin module